MAVKSLKKINTKLQFLYWQNDFLSPNLRRFLCNSLIQPQFDYACIFGTLNQKIEKQVTGYKINASVFVSNSTQGAQHIGATEFKEINLLQAKERVEQRIATKLFNY